MNILVIFTGGTIGSSVLGTTISTNKNNTYLLLDMFKKATNKNINFETAEPYYALSENNTGKNFEMLISYVSDALGKNYDGIIITHGTDTLQYTSAALSFAFGSNTIPIMIVSSNYVLTDERANGLQNFISAVDFIENKCGNGVFVSYQNTNDKPYIHRASRLLAHAEFSDDVYSINNQYYGYFNGTNFVKNENYNAKEDEITPFSKTAFTAHSEKIEVINSYVGLKYPKVDDNWKAVIIKAYHSGTLCTDDESFCKFAEELKEKNIPCYISGAKIGTVYESATVFDKYNLKILPFASTISQYIKIWFALQNNIDFNKIINLSLGEDIL